MTAVSLAGKPFYFCYPVFTYRVFSNDRDQFKKRYDIDYVRITSGTFMGEFIEANNVHEDVWHRKTLRPLTQILIPEVEFRRQPKANEPDRLSIKKTRDNIIHLVEKKSKDDSNK